MKKKSIILIGILLISFIFMASASAKYSQTIEKNQCSAGYDAIDTEFVFVDTPKPSGNGALTVSIQGDYYGGASERVGVLVEGEFLGYVPESGNYDDCLSYLLTRTFTVSQQQLNNWNTDGKIEVKLVQAYGYGNGDVECFCSTNRNIVTLEYTGANNSLPMNWIMKKFGLGKKD